MKRRRKLVLALGAVALAGPADLFAQSRPPKVARIGLMGLASASTLVGGVEALRAGLGALGYVEGKNLVIEVRWADPKRERLADVAAELVRLKVDIIVASQTPAVLAAKQATSTIPILMAPGGDPVGTGLVKSLARPEGNVTGLSSTAAELAAKNLELIREVSPSVKLVAVLANATDAFAKPLLEQIQLAGRNLNIKIHVAMVRSEDEFEAAFTEMAKMRAQAVIVQASLPRKRAVDLALKHRLPAFSTTRAFAEEGGLISYSANVADLYREVAVYADKILKGAKPADLPVQQPTKFELVINAKTARTLGVRIPAALLQRADQVIE